jgi:alpha-galactosidase
MLEVGNGGMTTTEYRAHFSMWCILAAPLIAGNDVRRMPPEIAEILLNREAVAVDQDPLGLQGRRVRREGDADVWAKQLADGGRAVALLNRGATTHEMSVRWSEIGYPDTVSASVRDLWEKRDLGKRAGSFSAAVPSHGVVLVKIKP